MADLAPIALFVYNRPEHTKQTIEALKQNLLARDSDLFIFSDEAKNETAEVAVNQVREYIRTIDGFNTVNIVERDRNLGLASSIIDGVTQLCNEYGRTVVLEDDLITSPYFLTYMNEALERYRDEKQVMQISGYMFPVELSSSDDALFLPFTTSWGWATWRRAWDKFDPEAKAYASLKKDRKLRTEFDLMDSYPYFDMLESQLNGRVNSWAIRWYLSVFINHGLVLYPPHSLVENIGMDGSGTHCVANHQGGVGRLAEIDSVKLPAIIESCSDKDIVIKAIKITTQTNLLKKVLKKIRGLFR